MKDDKEGIRGRDPVLKALLKTQAHLQCFNGSIIVLQHTAFMRD